MTFRTMTVTFLSITAMLILAIPTVQADEQLPSFNNASQTHVFVSIPPQAFFVERIGGNRVLVDILVQPGQNPATYAPTPKQMAKLAQSDIFFFIGVPFETVFLPKIHNSLPNLPTVDTRQGIDLQEMEVPVENGEHGGHLHQENELDPHVWLNPLLVIQQATIIRDTLSQLDPDGKQAFAENFMQLEKELTALHSTLTEILAPLRGRTFFVFHPAYGYFADAYGLKQVAVETGGKQPSGRHLANLIKRAKQEKVQIIFVQPQFSQKSADTIARAIDGAVVALDPLAKDYINNMKDMAFSVARALGK